MSTMVGKKPKNTFKDLLQVSNTNSGIDATLRDVEDGEGTASKMQLSSAATNFTANTYIGDSANANMTLGLTINQGAADNEILAFKSSDVALGSNQVTAFGVEADNYASFLKVNGGAGGLRQLLTSDAGSRTSLIDSFGGAPPNTTHTTAAVGRTTIRGGYHNDTAWVDTTDGNLLTVDSINAGGAGTAQFIVDEEGDIFHNGTAAAFDDWDDMALLDSFDAFRALEYPDTVGKQFKPSRYTANRYLKEDLHKTKMIQVVSDENWANGERTLICGSAEQRVMRGAMRQNRNILDALFETIGDSDPTFKAKLRANMVKRKLPTQILDWNGSIPA